MSDEQQAELNGDPAFIRPEEIAEHLGCGVSLVYEGLRRGEIPSRRVGRRYLVPRQSFLNWFEGAMV